jgi:CHASE3 domain sensor protein
MKNNITIGARLGSGFGFLLLIVVVIVCFSINETRKLNDSVKEIAKGEPRKNCICVPGVKGD